MGDWQTRSFWLGRRPYQPLPHLPGDEVADIVIVGGGFTGLWSAIQLKDADPAIDVVLLEQKVVGYGASGRNGGFAMTMVGRGLHDLLRKVGPERARATHLAMVRSLQELEAFCATEGIDADLTHPGLLTVSNGPEQDVRIRQDLAAADRLGLDDIRPLDAANCQELVHSARIRLGHWEDHALLLDPAALVGGLCGAARRRGVRIYEGTPVDALVPIPGQGVEARTPWGRVRADRALLATNAYAHAVPALRRYLFTICAYIVLTEPLREDQWARVGWDRRMGIEDKRIMPHFHRPTPDGRILWGGRDAPYSPVGPNPNRDRDRRIFRRLEESFRWTFPQLADVAIVAGWGGPVCGTVNAMAMVRWLSGERILAALGYAGHGVGPSHLVGKIVRELMLGERSELSELPMVTKRPIPLPPEPLRRLVLDGMQRILIRMDDSGQVDALARLVLPLLQ